MLKESIRMSWQNIRGNKMRTFLTMLGIIIGVTAIIALITTVGSATGEITSQFSALGAGKVSVSISGTAIKHGLNESDLAHIAALDNVAGVDPNVSLRTYAAQDGQLVEDVTLEGRSNDYFSVQDDLIGRGRALKAIDMDRSSHVCIIDQTLASAAFPNETRLGAVADSARAAVHRRRRAERGQRKRPDGCHVCQQRRAARRLSPIRRRCG